MNMVKIKVAEGTGMNDEDPFDFWLRLSERGSTTWYFMWLTNMERWQNAMATQNQ